MWTEITVDNIDIIQKVVDLYNTNMIKIGIMSEGLQWTVQSLQNAITNYPMTDLYFYEDGEVEIFALSRYKSDIDRIVLIGTVTNYIIQKITYDQDKIIIPMGEFYKIIILKYNKIFRTLRFCSEEINSSDHIKKYGITDDSFRLKVETMLRNQLGINMINDNAGADYELI